MIETKKLNGYIRWIVVAIAVGGLIFNTAVLYNDVKHLKGAVQEIKEERKTINIYLLQKK